MGIFNKIKSALSNTSKKITNFGSILSKRSPSIDELEELEEILLSVDFGFDTTEEIIQALKKRKIDKNTEENFLQELENIIYEILFPVQKPLKLNEGKVNVIMICGVNGNGKTTTIGKLAHLYKNQGKKVVIAACDTFRAAAKEQLEVWSKRGGAEFVCGEDGSDPASVAYKSLEYAKNVKADILLIDTAGRLHNQNNLMAELKKIRSVLKKLDDSTPDETILTLDATTGQNAKIQVEKFKEFADISGIIFTKLDGTAKGGAIVGISKKFNLPIYYLATGEGIDDIEEFDSIKFAQALVS